MPEQLTRQQNWDAKYNSEEQVSFSDKQRHMMICASLKAFDLPSSTPLLF